MNGIKTLFMVEAVTNTSESAGFRKEDGAPTNFEQKRGNDKAPFAEILGVAISEYRH